ncbi:hypothetical protein GWG67_15845 [Bradyrhizobium sp. CSS354]|nr:hypothetical protein [Bradyrhizobium sp. CSS354]
MDSSYDSEREAVAAMKLAAEADGLERQRWITAALAWSELTRLRGCRAQPAGRVAYAAARYRCEAQRLPHPLPSP